MPQIQERLFVIDEKELEMFGITSTKMELWLAIL